MTPFITPVTILNIKPQCYVESATTGGTVEHVFRNRNHEPVCLKIRCEDGKIDYLSIESINFFEPYDATCENKEEY